MIGWALSSTTAPVATLEVGHTSTGIWCWARKLSMLGSATAEAPVPDPLGTQVADRVPAIHSGPVVSPACGRLCSPAARAASKYGLNCGRGTPISGPPSPNPTSAGRTVVQGDLQRAVSALQTELAGTVEDPAQHDPEVALGRHPGVLDGLHELLRGDPADHRGVRGDGQLGVPDALSDHLGGDLVGEQPDALAGLDQVDHRQVDLDEVGEVAELEVVGQLLRVGQHDAGMWLGQPGDHRRRGRPDMVHMQLRLGQRGDEGAVGIVSAASGPGIVMR